MMILRRIRKTPGSRRRYKWCQTITILDKGAVVFTRIWCVFEIFLPLVDAQREEGGYNGVWDVYTAESHIYADSCYHSNIYKGSDNRPNIYVPREAVGIISGSATCDRRNANTTAVREAYFPFQVISQSIRIKIEEGKVSVEDY